MSTYEVMRHTYDAKETPIAVVTDYSEARARAAALGEEYGFREKFVATRERQFTGEVYAFSFEHGWAHFILCEDTGSFSIQSDWGDFQYAWPAPGRGKGTLKEFLATASLTYLADKLFSEGTKATEFDSTATILKWKTDPETKDAFLDLGYSEENALEELEDFEKHEAFMMYLMMNDDLDWLRAALGEEWHHAGVFKMTGRYLIVRDSILLFFQRFLRERLGLK